MKYKRLLKHLGHAFFIFFVLFLGSVAVGVFIQGNSYIIGLDTYGYEAITKGPHPKWLSNMIKPFNENFLDIGPMPSYYYLLILTFFILILIFNRSMAIWFLVCTFLGTFFTGLITTLDWKFVFRERPFETLPSNLDEISRNMWKNWSSYPSGHTRETVLYSVIATKFLPALKWPLIILCSFIAFSRVYVGAHFPTDVIAGALIGFISAKATLIITRELQILVTGKEEVEHGSSPKKEKRTKS